MANTQIVNDEQTLLAKLEEVRKAQAIYATYTQEQVDKIFFAAAMAANKQRIPLAKMAVEETGMGIVEDKVIKNHYASEYIYNTYKDVKTCGVIERDEAFGITKIAEPIGVIAAVIPTTNPTSTAIFKSLLALKTRNGLIFSPHPRAKKSTIEAAKVVLEAAVKAGAPEGIIGWIDEPSVPLSGMIMKEADIILATGGPGMVKAAYSSGKPAVGVVVAPRLVDVRVDEIPAQKLRVGNPPALQLGDRLLGHIQRRDIQPLGGEKHRVPPVAAAQLHHPPPRFHQGGHVPGKWGGFFRTHPVFVILVPVSGVVHRILHDVGIQRPLQLLHQLQGDVHAGVRQNQRLLQLVIEVVRQLRAEAGENVDLFQLVKKAHSILQNVKIPLDPFLSISQCGPRPCRSNGSGARACGPGTCRSGDTATRCCRAPGRPAA